MQADEDPSLYNIAVDLSRTCVFEQLESLGYQDDYFAELCKFRDECEAKVAVRPSLWQGASGEGEAQSMNEFVENEMASPVSLQGTLGEDDLDNMCIGFIAKSPPTGASKLPFNRRRK